MLDELRNDIYSKPQQKEETAEQAKERQEQETAEVVKRLHDMGNNGLKKN